MAGAPRTVILVRHADVDGTATDDTELNDAGVSRKEELPHVLGDAGIEEILVSPVVRSRRTAEDVAELLHITPTEITGAHLSGGEAAVAAAIQGLPPTVGVVLVVAHSHTLRPLISRLGGPAIAPIQSFDNLFILAGSSLTHLRYGAAPQA